MRKRLPLVLFGFGFWLLPMIAPLLAQEKAMPSPESISLEQIPDLLRKSDEPLKAKVEELIAAVDSEVKAKRVPPVVSENLRFALNKANSPSGINATTLLAGAGLPLDNDVVAKAADALQAASSAAQIKRAADFRLCLSVIAQRVTELTRDAKTSEEVNPVLDTVDLVQRWARSHANTDMGSEQTTSLSYCGTFLRSLSQILNIQTSEDAPALATDFGNFMSARQAARDFVSNIDARNRVSRTIEPLKIAAKTSQNTLVAALIGSKPAAEISADLSVFVEAAQRYSTAHHYFDMGGIIPANNDIDAYKALASMARSVEMRQWNEVRQGLGNTRQLAQQMDAERSVVFQKLIAKWDQDLKDAAEAEVREARQSLRAKLAAVKKPADLQAVAADFEGVEKEARLNRNALLSQGLSNQLSALAAAWSSQNPGLLLAQEFQGAMGGSFPFAAELTDLRSRIEREMLAQTLHAPELTQPPLLDQPLDAAMDSLCEKLATNHEWRRLLQTLEAQSKAYQAPGAPLLSGTDAISSLRSFLAGKNFELAEQWTDAALSYKAVLRGSIESTLIEDAALRLKTLAKEHPVEVKAAQSPAPEGSPNL
jgi:hypothetical protein